MGCDVVTQKKRRRHQTPITQHMGSSHLSIYPRLYHLGDHRRKGIRVYVIFSDNSILLYDNLRNSFPPVVVPRIETDVFFWSWKKIGQTGSGLEHCFVMNEVF